jgi:hypothetical protein
MPVSVFAKEFQGKEELSCDREFESMLIPPGKPF